MSNFNNIMSKYLINKQGQIYSIQYKKLLIQQIMDGYYYLNLTNDTGKHKCRIHRLLALQYIPTDDITLEIRPGNTCNFACQTCWPEASSRVHNTNIAPD